MSAERVKFFYDKIKELSQRIGELKLPEFFRKEVSTIIKPSWLDDNGNLSEKGADALEEELTNSLSTKAPDLYKEIQELFYDNVPLFEEDEDQESFCDLNESPYEEDNEDYLPFIFGAQPELIKYDPNEIDPINLCYLFVFTGIDAEDIFKDREEFYPFVEAKDSELAFFLENGYYFCSFFNLAQYVCKVNR